MTTKEEILEALHYLSQMRDLAIELSDIPEYNHIFMLLQNAIQDCLYFLETEEKFVIDKSDKIRT